MARPSPTHELVDILNANEVPATFFVVGKFVSFDSDSLLRAAESGHSIQNHTWDHSTMTRQSDYEIGSDLRRTSGVVKDLTGRATSCYRPPGGATNTRVRLAAAANGFAPEILWNVNPSDYLQPSPYAIASHILYRATGRGLIVGLHDGGGRRSNTVAALQSVITGLKARGYEFVTLCG